MIFARVWIDILFVVPSHSQFYRDTLDDLPESSEPAKNKTEEKEGEEEESQSSPPVLESMEIDEEEQVRKQETETMEDNEWGTVHLLLTVFAFNTSDDPYQNKT